MSLRTALLLAVIIFVVTVLTRLPASLLVTHLPPVVHCDEPSGTIWHGRCGTLRADGIAVPGLSWTLHPLPLLRLAIGADLSSTDAGNGGNATVLAQRNGDVAASAVNVVLPLAQGAPMLPMGSTGTLVLALPSFVLHAGHPVSIVGSAELRNFQLANPALDLGSFQIQFAPDAGDATVSDGQLRDMEGPLAVNGLLRLQSSGSFDLNGTIASRATASEDLNRTLQMLLGPEDAQGHHPFSLTGSL
jgi:Type II secretion system (T2SS), protein N